MAQAHTCAASDGLSDPLTNMCYEVIMLLANVLGRQVPLHAASAGLSDPLMGLADITASRSASDAIAMYIARLSLCHSHVIMTY